MKQFTGEQATFVYGDLDPSYKYAEILNLIRNKRIRCEIIQGTDHHFKGKLDEFINFPYKFLL